MSARFAAELAQARTILIVEDEATLAQLLVYNLQRLGYRTLVAADGLSACRLAAADRPDLILLDIMLPDLSGFDVCLLLKKHAEAAIANVPVIILSALGRREDIDRGLALGAAHYLPKPYSVRDVVSLVQTTLAESRA